MGKNYIPDNISDPDGIAMLTSPIIKGVMDLQGSMSKNGVVISSTPADLNLVAGFVAGAVTSGLARYYEVEITCANGTDVVVPIVVIPAGSIILEVTTRCTEAFDGATTTTFEVGVSGNTDKYIDPSDCPVTLAGVMSIGEGTNQDQKTTEALGASMTIQAVYTNTATATKGKMVVKVVYC